MPRLLIRKIDQQADGSFQFPAKEAKRLKMTNCSVCRRGAACGVESYKVWRIKFVGTATVSKALWSGKKSISSQNYFSFWKANARMNILIGQAFFWKVNQAWILIHIHGQKNPTDKTRTAPNSVIFRPPACQLSFPPAMLSIAKETGKIWNAPDLFNLTIVFVDSSHWRVFPPL